MAPKRHLQESNPMQATPFCFCCRAETLQKGGECSCKLRRWCLPRSSGCPCPEGSCPAFQTPCNFLPLPYMPVSKSKHFKCLGELRPWKEEAGRNASQSLGKHVKYVVPEVTWMALTSASRSPGVGSLAPHYQPSSAWPHPGHPASGLYCHFHHTLGCGSAWS